MRLYCWMVLLPLAALTIYTLFSMAGYYKKYDQIVRNITAANAYNLSFKEDMDYTMYRIVIGSAKWSDPEEKLREEDPYEQIEKIRKVFHQLYNITTTESNKRKISMLIKTLNTLEERVDEIVSNTKEPGHYDENMEKLDMNIRILTQIIQEQIQEYIYYEASSLESVRKEIAEEANKTLELLLTILVSVIIMTWLLSRLLSSSIARPIEEMCNVTQKVAKGDFNVRFEVDTEDELATLANNFNRMVKEISDLVEDIKVEQLNLRVTELKLLQAQINPHFLYNTLDTIIWMAESGQTDQVVLMVTALSDFFRTTLSKGRDFITIREEESHIRSYLQIQQFRYRDILKYEINIDEEIKDYQILKLTLQPIIENALYHGIKNKRGIGTIWVNGGIKNGKIELIVEDNGIGLKEEDLFKLKRIIYGKKMDDNRSGFGMANVQERIALNYGREYGMTIESEYEVGTKVSIVIPEKSEEI